ncbi:hypothetical protein M1L60_33655 [Actinoplanes sp. TRM 88003]|uniref:Uncharacterized protein n=1 Tax=Paractinoplanes aksuensis TaxID=2939490 RepID=A0ABT1DXN2_9ACTN|nr:M20/M25/M40 family metallo-hydrolase [Actinoplanes aksuensis]MCO8275542.1 hypothetical protein [Actinoplanes aksuensis]
MPTDPAGAGPGTAAAHPDPVRLRRALRAHVEAGLHRPYTQATVLEALAGLDLEVSQGVALSSVTAVVRGARPGPVVLLQAGLDDLSTAALVGAARILTRHRVPAGSVVLLLPPGEEDGSDAGRVIGRRVVQAAGTAPSESYTFHGRSDDRVQGIFRSRAGTVMGATDTFSVIVRSMSDRNRLPVAARIITALEAMTTRRSGRVDPVTITTLAMAPDNRLSGTVVTFSEDIRTRTRLEISQLCTTIAQAYGMTAEVAFSGGRPTTLNDAAACEFVVGVVGETLGPRRFEPLPAPIVPAGDVCRVLAEVPGCHVFVDAAATDDAILADASLVLAEVARRSLERLTAG